MRHHITDIYRIETTNSIYEIKVFEHDNELYSVCRRVGRDSSNRKVSVKGFNATTEYLEKLTIGASFDVPGVLITSVVKDYAHFKLSEEPKRSVEGLGIKQFFGDLATELVAQVKGEAAVMVAEPEVKKPKVKKGCQEPGCNYSAQGGPGHFGAKLCKSGSLASGGSRAHCSCDYCF
jgi:hypothetical protein